eukprot:12913382-Prorocentrum_lima.AAC.1
MEPLFGSLWPQGRPAILDGQPEGCVETSIPHTSHSARGFRSPLGSPEHFPWTPTYSAALRRAD